VRREEKAATPAGGLANAHKTTAAINLPRALRIHFLNFRSFGGLSSAEKTGRKKSIRTSIFEYF
jgi:hypothetical protein